MGILDFDLSKITGNSAFQLGSAIHANNNGHYGNFGAAMSGGMSDFNAMQQQQQLLEQQKKQQAWMQANHPNMAGAPDWYQKEVVKNQLTPTKPTSFMQNYEFAKSKGYKGTPYEFKTASGQNINIDMSGKGKEEWDKLRMKNLANSADERLKAASASRTTRDRLNQLQQILSNPEFKSGKWENTKYQLEGAFRSMGLNPSLVNNYPGMQEFEAGSGELVRELLNQATGPQTDNDRAFLERIQPQLGKTKEANQKIISFSQSRHTLDNIFATETGKWINFPDGQQALLRDTELKEFYRKAPASAMFKGQAVHFIDFYKMEKNDNPSVTDMQIVREWLKELKL